MASILLLYLALFIVNFGIGFALPLVKLDNVFPLAKGVVLNTTDALVHHITTVLLAVLAIGLTILAHKYPRQASSVCHFVLLKLRPAVRLLVVWSVTIFLYSLVSALFGGISVLFLVIRTLVKYACPSPVPSGSMQEYQMAVVSFLPTGTRTQDSIFLSRNSNQVILRITLVSRLDSGVHAVLFAYHGYGGVLRPLSVNFNNSSTLLSLRHYIISTQSHCARPLVGAAAHSAAQVEVNPIDSVTRRLLPWTEDIHSLTDNHDTPHEDAHQDTSTCESDSLASSSPDSVLDKTLVDAASIVEFADRKGSSLCDGNCEPLIPSKTSTAALFQVVHIPFPYVTVSLVQPQQSSVKKGKLWTKLRKSGKRLVAGKERSKNDGSTDPVKHRHFRIKTKEPSFTQGLDLRMFPHW